MSIVTCVGINHITSPVEEREELAFTGDELSGALKELGATLGGVVLVSTCNRTELYTTSEVTGGDELIAVLNALKGAAVADEHFYVLSHKDAVAHLYRVAAGIDSMVLGESQILGQVREAMSAATEAGTLNGVLSHVFHTAMTVGKRARHETEIGRHAVSVGSAAVMLARKSLGDLENKTVLVISAGSMGKLAAKALAQQTGSKILLANRTQERAADLAEQLGGNAEAYDMEHLRDALSVADIVISGTSAEEFILSPDDVRPVMEARPERELLFIDIAVPRDIDPTVVDVSGVHLWDIDDVEAVTEEGWNGRQAEVAKVEAIIAEEVAAFEGWWKSLDVVPVITALVERAESIRASELERTIRALPELDTEARDRIEAMTQAIVKKLLDRPIARLKDGADTGLYMEALEDLFDVHSNGRRARP